MDSYDFLPYESASFPETHPDALSVMGRLFGLESARPDDCRVLELGCAAGGNLIPMAYYLPTSRFVGIERSAKQARQGQELIERLGLRNAEIRCEDILAVPPDLGEFDFIIAHGVYSWVPAVVQERLLSLCRDLLAPQGIAYVSFNTLPGWRLRGVLRDLLLFHTRASRDDAERLSRAQTLLETMRRVLTDREGPEARLMARQVEALQAAHPSYLFHEYLEPENEALLLVDFLARAEAAGLQYVGDVDLSTMFASASGDEAARFLEGFDSLEMQEQYTDFLSLRSFRQSLLCHGERRLVRDIDLGVLDELAVFSTLAPPRKLDLRRAKHAPFTEQSGERYPVSHPLTKAALQRLYAAYPSAVSYPLLEAEAQALVGSNGGGRLANETDDLRAELFSLYANQAIGLSRGAVVPETVATPHPASTALSRAEVEQGLGFVVTIRHRQLQLDHFAQRLVTLLDGYTPVATIIERLVEELGAGGFTPAGDRRPSDPERFSAAVRSNCERLLQMFVRHGIVTQAASPPRRDRGAQSGEGLEGV